MKSTNHNYTEYYTLAEINESQALNQLIQTIALNQKTTFNLNFETL